jgi:hypothetical protein
VDENIAREILDELFSSLETLETQSAAILRFVKDKGLASEQDLAPYFEQAGNASNVRWRAARVRIDHLLASAFKAADRKAKEESPKPEDKNEKFANQAGAEVPSPTKSHEENEDNSQQKHKEAARAKLEAADAVPASGENPDHQKHTPDHEKDNTGNNKTAQEKQNASGAGTSDSTKKNAA